MSTQDQARNLMMRQQLVSRNRQQSMLTRAAKEVGLDTGRINYDGYNPTMS